MDKHDKVVETVPEPSKTESNTGFRLSQPSIDCLLVFSLSLAFFLYSLGTPDELYFDEHHYVPAAREYLQGLTTTNPEHPPIGKWLIALGLFLFGENPWGWRFTSTIFGAITVTATYTWTLTLFDRVDIARWVAILTLANQFVFVHARIAMLDIFMIAFMMIALTSFCALWRTTPEKPNFGGFSASTLLAITGTALGLGIATKLFVLVLWCLMLCLFAVLRLFQHWRVKFEDENADHDWYHPQFMESVSLKKILFWFFVVPIIILEVSYIPVATAYASNTGNTIADALIFFHMDIVGAHNHIPPGHEYESTWWQWPLITRPIWFHHVDYERVVMPELDENGNPVIEEADKSVDENLETGEPTLVEGLVDRQVQTQEGQLQSEPPGTDDVMSQVSELSADELQRDVVVSSLGDSDPESVPDDQTEHNTRAETNDNNPPSEEQSQTDDQQGSESEAPAGSTDERPDPIDRTRTDPCEVVILLGNFFIQFGGLIAVVFAAYTWLMERRRESLFIFAPYLVFTVFWIVLPRKVQFYFYYFPNTMMFGPALALLFDRLEAKHKIGRWIKYHFLVLVVALSINYYPIYSGRMIVGGNASLSRWLFFDEWY